ncbi:MAG: hypothetical protein ACI3Y9_04775 [Candidatus Cryptobacteroides sp.]
MTYFELAGRVPDHGLEYPGFSAVFIQTFSIRKEKKFKVPAKYMQTLPDGDDMVLDESYGGMRYKEKADALGIPIAPMNNDIESQIFVLPENDADAPDERSVRRFSLRGFDFEMDLNPCGDEEFPPITMHCHVNVELSLFFGHTVSLTYRFLFDRNAGILSRPATTDHIIALLSTYLGAEYWSAEKEDEASEPGKKKKTDINLESGFTIEDFHYDAEGNPLDKGIDLDFFGKGRTFEEITTRYKKFIYRHCSVFDLSVPKKELIINKKHIAEMESDSASDSHYAMVDLWENIMHPDPVTGEDYFSKDREQPLTEGQIVAHIQNEHKHELIGLMTLYPGEWPYRDPEAFDEVCGENIAIDTDDLVLVNNNMCMVLGTYGRRGSVDGSVDDDSATGSAVNWAEHLQERARYHVSWPEYLMILQMVLAKKYVIGKANDELVNATLSAGRESAYELIGKNAELSLRLSQIVLLLDVVKYSKFTSHKVMFDRTTRRLNLDGDMERLNEMMSMVDSSLHNLSDYKAMGSDFMLNFILALISVASTFELFFQNSEMPFLTYFGFETTSFAAIVVAVVFGVTIFAFLLVIAKTMQQLIDKVKKYL